MCDGVHGLFFGEGGDSHGPIHSSVNAIIC